MSRKIYDITVLGSWLFIGIPGAIVLIWGILAAAVSFLPGAEVDIAGSNLPIVGFLAGVVACLIGTLLIWIPCRIKRLKTARRQI